MNFTGEAGQKSKESRCHTRPQVPTGTQDSGPSFRQRRSQSLSYIRALMATEFAWPYISSDCKDSSQETEAAAVTPRSFIDNSRHP